jgi:hypothetical protein
MGSILVSTRRRMTIIRGVALVSLCVVTACSAGNPYTFSSLSEEGILLVSSENPYLGSNIFLSNEMEESRYLYKFMKEKGAPQAIELTGHDIDRSELKLFYSGRQEMYTAVPEFDRALGTKEWIVRGPYALERSAYRQVSGLPSGQGGVFEIRGRREVLGGELRAAETRSIPPVFVQPIQPQAKKRPTRAAQAKNQAPAKIFAGEDPLKNPSNLDQQALAEARQGKKNGQTKLSGFGPAVTIGAGTGAADTKSPTSRVETIPVEPKTNSTPAPHK